MATPGHPKPVAIRIPCLNPNIVLMNAIADNHSMSTPTTASENTPDRPVPLDDTCDARDAIIRFCNLTEITGEDGGPFIRLKLKNPPFIEAGYMRLWQSPPGCVVDRLFHIYVGGQGNDINLMYAMTRADSPVPHFFLHYNLNPPSTWSYHIDLPGKVDGVMYPDYWEQVFSPLSAITEQKKFKVIPTRRIQADRKQYLSTWGFYGKEVDEAEYRLIRDEVVPVYLQRFFDLLKTFPYDSVDRQYLIERGRKQMDILLKREMDLKGWGRLEALFGREAGDLLRQECRREHHPIDPA